MTEKSKTQSSDLFEQAFANYEKTFKTSLKMQEEASKHWSELFAQAMPVSTWQTSAQSVNTEAVGLIRKQLEESLKVIEQCSQKSIELLKQGLKSIDVPPSESTPAQLQELWQSCLQALQRNAQSVVHLNGKVMSAWSDFVRKTAATAVPIA
jgi:polyhydroxyalkanoate synthesis regulator protein